MNNLVKWFRKNNTKLMAVVVIVLMVGFIGGSSLSYLLGGSGQTNDTIAHYGVKHLKVTRMDRTIAAQELEILQNMGIDRLLSVVLQQRQDIGAALLSQLLFEQSSAATGVMDTIKQVIQQNQLRISDNQLAAFSDRTVPTDVYWLLLRNEAEEAGFRLPIEEVGTQLGQLIPMLFNGADYSTVMNQQTRRFGVPAETIIATVGKFLAVLEYADAATSQGVMTIPQIRNVAAAEGQSMDIEFVRIAAATFADEEMTPPESQLQTHFDLYKNTMPGQVSQDNPFGFGYKQPARLQLDYIALKLDDVESILPQPTSEEMETYYRQNRNREFAQQVPVDPGDPQSATVTEIRSYIEVAETIRAQLLRNRVVTKAQQILLEAQANADADLPLGTGEDKPSVEALAEAAVDYLPIAENLSSKYNLPVYSGRTGRLSATDIVNTPYLGRLSLTNYGPAAVPLVQMLFSVDALGDDAVALLSAPQAQMYRTIGPAQEPTLASSTNLTGKVIAIVRIVDVLAPGTPELDTTYSTKAMALGDDDTDEDAALYSVREKVIEDVRNLVAWDTATAKADEFVTLVNEQGWDKAVNEFNTLYGDPTKDDPNDPNVFNVDRLMGVQPISSRQLSAFRMQTESNPSAAEFVESLANERMFINELYSLIPADSNSLAKTPVVMPYRPDMSLYCLKDATIRRVTQEQYQAMKGTLLSRERYMKGQELAVVHFTPANIVERMRFAFKEEVTTPANEDEKNTEATEDES